MAAAGKKVVIAPPAIKKPDIAIKKPLIPVTPAKKASGSKGSPLQQAAGGADGKPPPPKPVLVAKKGVGGTPASAAGETKATALKKPAVVSPPGKTATPKEGSKAPQKKPGQDTRKKDGKGGGAAAASKAVKKVYGGSPKEGGGGGAQQKRAKEEKKKSRDKGGGGFLSRLFGRRAEPDSDEDDESSDNKVKQVAPPPPRFENVKPRKMVGGAKPGAGGAGPPKFGTGEARKFQPLRKGAGLPGAPAGKSEEGHDMASKLKGPMPSVKEIPVKPDTKLAGKKSMSSKLPPANGPGPPPLKKAEGIAAGVPSRGEGGDKTEAGNDLDKALSPLPPKILPKIEPKKPIPTAPAKPLGIAPKKIDIVPKKLPSPKKEEEPEPAKKAAKPPSPPPPGEKKEAEGEGKRQGLVGKNLGGFPKKEASGDEPMGDGEKKEGGKKPSVFDRLMAKDKDAKGPAPKRTLADLLGKDTGKPSAAATGGGRADDDSLPGKVKNFLQKHPQHYPKSDDELRQDIPDSQLKIVQDGIGASEADAAALRKATKAAYGFELARRLVKDFGASNWGSRRQDLLEGKLGPEPVAKELARDNPKLAELRDWTALVQAYAAEGKALTAALDRLKTENSKAHTELLQAPFNDRDKFNSVAAPIVSKVKASEENAALDPAYLQEHLQDFAAHTQALTEVRSFLEKEPDVLRNIVDAPKFKEKPKASAAAASTTKGAGAAGASAGGGGRSGSAGTPSQPATRGWSPSGSRLKEGSSGGLKIGAKASGPSLPSAEALRAHGEKLFSDALSKLVAAFGDKYRSAILAGVAHEFESMAIPQGTCWLIEQLLIEDPITKVFTHHRVISYLLGFLDSTAYIRFRQCSKLLCRAVEMDLNKRLYRLPFQFYSEKTDIGYFFQVVSFFCRLASRLEPMDRMQYRPTMLALKAAQWMAPVSADSMHSQLYVSLDRIPHEMISSREAERPYPHLWRKSSAHADPLGKVTSTEISLYDFIAEYRKRVFVVRDEIVWQQPVDDLDADSVCSLLQQLLKTLKQIAEHHNGVCVFRRTEYMLNTGIEITHRVWLQCTLIWNGDLQAPQRSRRLHLTIADHFRWTG